MCILSAMKTIFAAPYDFYIFIMRLDAYIHRRKRGSGRNEGCRKRQKASYLLCKFI